MKSTDFLAAARANTRSTALLIAAMLFLTFMIGYMVGWFLEVYSLYLAALTDGLTDYPVWFFSAGGVRGGMITLAVGAAWALLSLTAANTLVMQQCGGHYLMPFEAQQVHNVVEEMSIAAGLPKPKVVIIETDVPNAFAFGMSPKSAIVGVTRGLLNRLDREELQGVIGHEMGHVANLDIRYATAVGVLVGAISLASESVIRLLTHRRRYRSESEGESDAASDATEGASGGGDNEVASWAIVVLFVLMVAFIFLAPLLAKMVQMAVSRQREYLADATSVRFTRNPAGLIRALEKISQQQEPFDGAAKATQHMFIINPFRKLGEKANALMSTHPPLEKRLERLRNLSGFS
ncbi:MAG: hypothetical protein A2516_08940 [Alphaproteobacteria bacterium RIFOXYD12_FULL_60_8]|nr:MAG: hypothetical protein A2516_08940 [Alphaproteobacteria bacterium RIFOXYD12_FULL_60_8]